MIKQLKILVMVILMAMTNIALAHEFSWDNLMLSDAKLSPSYDYEVYVDAYMARYRTPIWKKYKNDEFELEDKRLETIEMMKARFESFDLEQEFEIKTTFEFGKYDFNELAFPLEGITANSFYYKAKAHMGENIYPYRYNVHFMNPEIIGRLSMEKEIAKEFIQRKKSASGRVDRKLPTLVKFKIIQKRDERSFDALITEVIIYDKDRSTILESFKEESTN